VSDLPICPFHAISYFIFAASAELPMDGRTDAWTPTDSGCWSIAFIEAVVIESRRGQPHQLTQCGAIASVTRSRNRRRTDERRGAILWHDPGTAPRRSRVSFELSTIVPRTARSRGDRCP